MRDETISFHSWFYTLFYHGEAERCHEYEEAVMDLLPLVFSLGCDEGDGKGQPRFVMLHDPRCYVPR